MPKKLTKKLIKNGAKHNTSNNAATTTTTTTSDNNSSSSRSTPSPYSPSPYSPSPYSPSSYVGGYSSYSFDTSYLNAGALARCTGGPNTGFNVGQFCYPMYSNNEWVCCHCYRRLY